MTDTPTPTDEEIAALCEWLRAIGNITDAARVEALQADLAKSRGVVMSLTQRLADAQAERDELKRYERMAFYITDFCTKHDLGHCTTEVELCEHFEEVMAENARMAGHVEALRSMLGTAQACGNFPVGVYDEIDETLATTAPETDDG